MSGILEIIMEITVLIENKKLEKNSALKTEHGLSLHVRHNQKEILIDCGGSDGFLKNAGALGIDISQIDFGILTHHHYDHGGGLSTFLGQNAHGRIHLAGKPSGALYFKGLGGIIKKYIGLDQTLFEKYPKRFQFVKGMVEISPDLYLLTEIVSTYPRPKGNQKLFAKTDSGYILDNFPHELVAVMREKDGVTVFAGCAHSGILNMVESVVRCFPDSPIKAVVGGFHLAGIPVASMLPESKDEIREIAKQLLKYPIDKVYTGHCTGLKAYNILKKVMRDRLEYMATGRFMSF